jgi:hypothetical protein
MRNWAWIATIGQEVAQNSEFAGPIARNCRCSFQ